MKISPIIFLTVVLSVATAKNNLKGSKSKHPSTRRAKKGHKNKLEFEANPDNCIGFPAGYSNGNPAALVPCDTAPNFKFDKETLQLKVEDKSLPKIPEYCLAATAGTPQVNQCVVTDLDQKWAGIRVPNTKPPVFTIFSLFNEQTLEDDTLGGVAMSPQLNWLNPVAFKRFSNLKDHSFC